MELMVHSPEFTVGDPYASRHEGLREYLDTPEMHEQFEAAIDAAVQLAPNTSALQAITYTADILRWGYWGAYGSPLPAGMIFAQTAKGTELHFDGELLDSGLAEETYTLIANCGFSDFTRQVRHTLDQHAEQVRDFTAPVLERHPVVRLLRGIAEQEGSERFERPLTEYEKMLGASMIGTEVKVQFGMHEAEAFAMGSPAEFRYKRRIAQQELATVEDRPRSTAAHEMVKAVIESYADKLIGSYADYPDKITSKEQAVRLLREEAAAQSDVDHFDDIAGHMIADLAKQPSDFNDSVVEFVLGRILRNVYQNTEGTVSRTLDVNIADETETLYDRFRDVMPNSLEHPYTGMEVFALLNQPRQETTTPTPYGYDRDDAYYALESMGDNMYWEDVPELLGSIGTVEAAGSEHVGRLLQYRPVKAPYVGLREAPQHDMSVTIENGYSKGTELPIVPGYTLLARAANYDSCTYFYEANQDDPYAECLLPIKEAGRQKLVDAYRDIGLVDLSIAVAEAEALTVGELTRLIADNSVYGSIPADGTKRIYDISDCADFVSDGRLVAQCTGARAFLHSSIKEASWADENHGYVFLSFNGSALGVDDVPRQTHAQLGLISEGKLYILDATSSNALQVSSKQPQRLVQPATPSERDALPEMQAGGTHEMNNEERLKSLESMLSRILGIPQDDRTTLLEKLAQLPEDDPMLAVYRISLGFKNNPESIADLYAKTVDFYPKVLKAMADNPEVLVGTAYQRYRNRRNQMRYLLDHLESYRQD